MKRQLRKVSLRIFSFLKEVKTRFLYFIGKYLTIPRTEGVSTTDIVGRILLLSRAHHDLTDSPRTENSTRKLVRAMRHDADGPLDRKSQFLTTSRMIRLFGAGVKVNNDSQQFSKSLYSHCILGAESKR
jgi:hypothetical protein